LLTKINVNVTSLPQEVTGQISTEQKKTGDYFVTGRGSGDNNERASN